MNFWERIQYSILFLLDKYLDLKYTNAWLSTFEARMLHKYLSQEPIPPSPVPQLLPEELTDQKFREITNEYRGPVLLKGFLKNSQAVQKWNLEYLVDVIDDFKINTMTFDDKFVLEYMSFREFADKIQENLYINNNHTIFSAFPELFADVSPEIDQLKNKLTSFNLRNVHIANLFIGYNKVGKKCSGSNLHCGGSGNVFCMIRGNKTWTLIDPKWSCLLKGRVAQSGIHAQTLFEMGDARLEDYPEVYTRLPRYEFTMEPGDVLWNAPWWWHRIKNGDGLSIGVAVRNNKVTGLNFANNPTFTLAGWIYLLYNSWTIGLYEKLFLSKDTNFGASKKEDHHDNVLYQIEMLMKKYPRSVHFKI